MVVVANEQRSCDSLKQPLLEADASPQQAQQQQQHHQGDGYRDGEGSPVPPRSPWRLAQMGAAAAAAAAAQEPEQLLQRTSSFIEDLMREPQLFTYQLQSLDANNDSTQSSSSSSSWECNDHPHYFHENIPGSSSNCSDRLRSPRGGGDQSYIDIDAKSLDRAKSWQEQSYVSPGSLCGSEVDVESQTTAPASSTPLQTNMEAPDEDAASSTLTVSEASFMVCNYVLNIGIFSVPFAFQQSGYITVVLVVGASLLCNFTARMLGEVLDHLRATGIESPNFADAATAAGGSKLAAYVHTTCMAELWSYGFGNLVVLSQTLTDLFPQYSFGEFVVFTSLLTWVLTVFPDKVYAYVSLCASLAVVVASLTLLVSGFDLPEWAASEGPVVGPWNTLPSSFALLIYGAACHPVLPPLFNSMKSKKDYHRATRNGWAIWALLCIVLGAGAFYFFGPAVQVIATRNIGHDLQMHHTKNSRALCTLSALCLVIRLQGSNVPVSRPLVISLARAVNAKLRKGHGGLNCFLLAAPFLACFALSAYFLKDQLAVAEAISACFLMGNNGMIFPAIAYWSICRPETVVDKAKVLASGLVGVGLVATVGLSYVL